MSPLYNQYICPGPSSQTTSIKVENLIVHESLNLGFFNASAPIIRKPSTRKWEEAAKDVLQERVDLWEKLSKL